MKKVIMNKILTRKLLMKKILMQKILMKKKKKNTHIVKLIFKAYKKLIKHFVIIIFSCIIKMFAEYYQKTKKSFQKRLVKGTKIFQKKKKKRSVNMVVNNIKKF